MQSELFNGLFLVLRDVMLDSGSNDEWKQKTQMYETDFTAVETT